MYESLYGFQEKPFSLIPDPRFFFVHSGCRLALCYLDYGILNQPGLILLTGEPGTGKTALLQKILLDHQDRLTAGFVTLTPKSEDPLLPWILMGLEVDVEKQSLHEMFQILKTFIIQKAKSGKPLLLVVDEAQNLHSSQLEELKMLSNLNDRPDMTLNIILAGHTELRGHLKRHQALALMQRIGIDFQLETLDLNNTILYIHHRLQVAGGSPHIFSEKAYEAVYRFTEGNTRLINQVCEISLVFGYAEQRKTITAELVINAAQERAKGGMLPLFLDWDMTRLIEEEKELKSSKPSFLS